MHERGAAGELSSLLTDIARAATTIAGYVRGAGLLGVLGRAGSTNVQGEDQQKLDVLANDAVKATVGKSALVCVMGSEEDDDPIPGAADGKYVVLHDPLDGSSNIDVNVSIGTIFSIHRRASASGAGTLADCLQPGRKQVAAGYVMYGPSTLLVYSAGHGVHAFTLDPASGAFLLTVPSMTTPARGKYYSANESNMGKWTPPVRRAVEHFKTEGWNARYVGSLVADFHRNLIHGGVYLYPADTKSPDGKLRLLYEASPLAFVAEQAGGAASNGTKAILDIEPKKLHQRTPLIIGSKEEVALVQNMIREDA
ncbi:MAG TPA: class 1 fructose-bisphosphatase [Gemmatimonadales bacterium]